MSKFSVGDIVMYVSADEVYKGQCIDTIYGGDRIVLSGVEDIVRSSDIAHNITDALKIIDRRIDDWKEIKQRLITGPY